MRYLSGRRSVVVVPQTHGTQPIQLFICLKRKHIKNSRRERENMYKMRSYTCALHSKIHNQVFTCKKKLCHEPACQHPRPDISDALTSFTKCETQLDGKYLSARHLVVEIFEKCRI